MDPGPILELSEITKDGLTVDHIAILESLRNLGNIAGLENISNHSGRAREDIVTLEKLLVKKGLIDMGGKGRELTIKGMKALNEAVGKK
jgi:Holliday junction resolvasome RuvABC ATP-dependent DNA helicase subunit